MLFAAFPDQLWTLEEQAAEGEKVWSRVLLPFSSCLYSSECVEGKFCELPLYGVLGSGLDPGLLDAFLLQRLLAGASDLHTDEPKGG